jgi:hypothetical protein
MDNLRFKKKITEALIATLEMGERCEISTFRYSAPTCCYRGTHGKKCFVGRLIKDKLYDEEMEGKIFNNEMVRGAVEESMGGTLNSDQGYLITILQSAHDKPHIPPGRCFVMFFMANIKDRVDKKLLPDWVSKVCEDWVKETNWEEV